ncbi:MAG: retroviral-like aspartic protease family protein [Novosphingobium sp.]
MGGIVTTGARAFFLLRALAPTLSLLFAVAVPAQELPSPPPERAGEEVVKGQADSAQRLTVPVLISGQGPYRFVLDTGSQKSVVSRSIADNLALVRGNQVEIIGLAGSEIVDTATIGELGIGRRRHRDMDVVIFENEHIGADGILGLDSLQGQRVLIDFSRNLMAVGDARSLGGSGGYEIVVTAQRRRGQLIMTNAVIDGVKVDVVIDTGSDTTVANRALQRALQKNERLQPVMLIGASGQKLMADLGVGKRMEIDTIGITNLLVAFTDAPAFAILGLDQRPAVLLGMRELRLFKRIAIDFSRRKVYFDIPSQG